jgi:hypothetical protein
VEDLPDVSAWWDLLPGDVLVLSSRRVREVVPAQRVAELAAGPSVSGIVEALLDETLRQDPYFEVASVAVRYGAGDEA